MSYPLLLETESGSTTDFGLGPGANLTTSSSAATMIGLPTMEREPRRRLWRVAAKTLAVAALPLAQVYDPPRRGLLEAAVSNILVIVGDVGDDVLDIEPESLLTIAPDRPTLWFVKPLPILAPRRPYIPPTWDLADEDE